MPLSNYVNLYVGRQKLDLPDDGKIGVKLNFKQQNPDDVQSKESSTAFNVTVPATIHNDEVLNTFHNAAVEDFTTNQVFKSNRPGIIEANGNEILVGKVFLVNAKHTNLPVEYQLNFYGDNADWLVDLKETTLADCWNDIQILFNRTTITDSWNFDGTITYKDKPYVFAPVRYGGSMDSVKQFDVAGNLVNTIDDYNMFLQYFKPSMSKYWTLFRGFKLAGYRIVSEFFDLEYFRRQVMPWTWGNFLESDGTALDNLDFLAKSEGEVNNLNADGDTVSFTAIMDMKLTNDSTNGAFDNNNVYSYDTGTFEGKWTYPTDPQFDYGPLEGTFHFNAYVDAEVTNNSDAELRLQWFLNGVRVIHQPDNGNGTFLMDLNAPLHGKRFQIGQVEDFATFLVNPGDVVSIKLYGHTFDSGTGHARMSITIDAFELDYFRIPVGGTVDFANLPALKKWKFLDFFSGIVDEFDLTFQTDPISKIIYIEPEHPYSLVDDQSTKAGGWYAGHTLDWTYLQDLKKESVMDLFSDYVRELSFNYKDDSNDGSLKVVQDRNVNVLALAKYVFPDRFKTGSKKIENRFFAPLMHWDVVQWKSITGTAPQIPILAPENISNTSRDAAQNTFEPKSAYYKGMQAGWGWYFDNGAMTSFPYMFAVNYRPGGEEDPILSYADERIQTADPLAFVIGKGLLRRFYLQRLAIMRNGQYYLTWFKLKNIHVLNRLHREHIIVQGQRYELAEIMGYDPMSEDSTQVLLIKHSPITGA